MTYIQKVAGCAMLFPLIFIWTKPFPWGGYITSCLVVALIWHIFDDDRTRSGS